MELDQPLRYGMATVPVTDPGLVAYHHPTDISFRVEDPEGQPVQHAEVRSLAATASPPVLTDRSGVATLTVGEQEANAIAGVLVRPTDSHWSVWRPWPTLSTVDSNRIVCAKLDTRRPATGHAGSWGSIACHPPTVVTV